MTRRDMRPLYEPTAVAAAKIYARHVGDHGHSGGWIHDATGRRIVQGWENYAQTLIRSGIVVPKKIDYLPRKRYAINWRRGHGPQNIDCPIDTCPKNLGGLYGVTA